MQYSFKKNSLLSYILLAMLTILPALYRCDVCFSWLSMNYYIHLVSIILLIVILVKRNSYRVNNIDWAVSFCFLFCFLHILLFSGDNQLLLIVNVIGYFSIYSLFRNVSCSFVFVGLFLSGVIQSVWALGQILYLFPSYNSNFLCTACFNNPAILACLLIFSIISGLFILSNSSERNIFIRGMVILCLCLMVFILLKADSRASYVALATGMIWVYLSKNKERMIGIYCNRIRFLLYALLFIFAITTLLYLLYLIRPDSVNGRMLIWNVSAEIFKDSPTFGHGISSFSSKYMLAQANWFSNNPNSSFIGLADNTEYAFNELIRIACETGIVGLVIFTVCLVYILYVSFGKTRVLIFCGAIVFSLSTFSFFSYPLSINFALFFLIVFIALISNQISIGSFVSIYKYLRFAVIVVLLLTMALLTKKFVICKQVQKIFVNNINDLPLGFHEKYYYYMCHNSDFMNVYSKFLFDNGQYEEAIPVMERTITLKASSELVSDYGFAIEKCGKDEEAEAAYKLAKAMTPGYVKPSYRLFLLYKRNGYIDLALNEAYHILKMKAKVVNTTVIRIRNEVRSFIKIKCHD